MRYLILVSCEFHIEMISDILFHDAGLTGKDAKNVIVMSTFNVIISVQRDSISSIVYNSV